MNIVIYALEAYSVKTDCVPQLFLSPPIRSTQVLSETANISLEKLRLPLDETRNLIVKLESLCEVVVATSACVDRAFVAHLWSLSAMGFLGTLV